MVENITKNGGAQQELLDQIQPGETVRKKAQQKNMDNYGQ